MTQDQSVPALSADMAASATRRQIVAAASRLFADRGVDGPSLREITRKAGQRNTNALQYHFGDRDAVVLAVLADREGEIARRRWPMLARADVPGDLRSLAEALVLPAAAELQEGPAGREYLQVVGEVTARPARFASLIEHPDRDQSLPAWGKVVEPFLPRGSVGRPLHRRYAAMRFSATELAGRARERPDGDHRLFVSQLVDLVTAVLGAPISDGTAALIRPDA